MIPTKINHTINDSLIIHLYEIAFAYFLIMSDKGFTMGAAYLQNMAAADFFAVWIWIDNDSDPSQAWPL